MAIIAQFSLSDPISQFSAAYVSDANSSGEGVVIIPPDGEGVDLSDVINEALANPDTDVVRLEPGEYWIGSSIFVPPGKTLIGSGQEATVIKVLPSFGPLPGNGAIVVQSDASLSNLTLDGDKVNLGQGADARVHGVLGTGDGFLVEHVSVKNATGYAFWGVGTSGEKASGVFRDLRAENSNVLFETTFADGVLFERCVGSDGDGDIGIESVFHPLAGSSNITFRDCHYDGYATIASISASTEDQVNIRFENVEARTSGSSIGIFIGGPFLNEVHFVNSSITAINNAVNAYDAVVFAENSRFESEVIGFALISGSANFVDSVAIGLAPIDSDYAAFGVYALGEVDWVGGQIYAAGGPGSAAHIGSAAVDPSTATIVGETAVTDEITPRTIDVLLNDMGADGAMLHVTAIEDVPVAAGAEVTLASGAIVRFNADGTVTYDPNGAFDWLSSPVWKIGTSAAIDSFTYALDSGHVSRVVVHINGIDDVIAGGAGDDVIAGTDGGDLFDLSQGGGDAATGGSGNDGFYFGATLDSNDQADGGPGVDTLAIQGTYADLVLGAMTGVEVLLVASGSDDRFGDIGGNLYAYDITSSDGNVDAGGTLTVHATGLLPGETLSFDGSAETDGHFRLFASQGLDRLTGGGGNDGFFFGADGNLTEADRVDGGAGIDSIALRGDYFGPGAVAFDEASFTGIEVIVLLSGHTNEHGGPIVLDGFDYELIMADGNVAAGATLDINGVDLQADESVLIDGRAETDGSFRILSGAGGDSLHGGAGADLIYGGLGADLLDGGLGGDTYVYRDVGESAGDAIDQIIFSQGDRIDLRAIDANGATPAIDSLTFIGAAAFSGAAGELRVIDHGDGQWTVEADASGDGIADLIIDVTSAGPIGPGEFVL